MKIFISSTLTGLKAERKNVIDQVLKLGHQHDYYHAQDLGRVTAQTPRLSVTFWGFLLAEVSPAKAGSQTAH